MIRGFSILAYSLAELARPIARLKNTTALIEPRTVSYIVIIVHDRS